MRKHLAAAGVRIIACAATFAMLLCAAAWAQADQTTTTTTTTETQAATQKIHLTSSVIRAAQQKLNDAGYQSGTPDGKLGPQTRAAISKYQKDQNLAETGTLDQSTLSKLDVGGNQTMATAPGDLKTGAKAAGRDIKGKHPVAAAKDMGKGIGEAGKAVGEGTKSDVVSAKNKTKSKIERKKTQHEEHEKAEDTATPK